MLERRDFDITRYEVPVDKKAAMVVSKGFQYKPKKNVRDLDSDYPIPVRALPDNNPNFQDLTGFRFGRLRVIGLAKDYKQKWVCRCDCGKYTLRKSKAVKNPENYGDRCDLCQHHAFLIKTRRWKETGKDLDQRDV